MQGWNWWLGLPLEENLPCSELSRFAIEIKVRVGVTLGQLRERKCYRLRCRKIAGSFLHFFLGMNSPWKFCHDFKSLLGNRFYIRYNPTGDPPPADSGGRRTLGHRNPAAQARKAVSVAFQHFAPNSPILGSGRRTIPAWPFCLLGTFRVYPLLLLLSPPKCRWW